MFAIFANELRRRLRDRSAIVLAFVAPLALAAILGLAFHGSGTSLAVEVTPASAVPIVAGVLGTGSRIVAAPSAALLHHDVESGTVDAGIDLGGSTPLVLVRADRPQAAAIGEVLQATFSNNPGATSAGARVVVADQTAPGPHGLVGYFAPSMGIVFLFFIASVGARSLLAERESGTLVRLRSAPIAAGRVLAGKVAAMFGFALTSMLVLWAATVLVFSSSWGAPVPVAIVVIATCLAMTGVGAIVTVLSRSAEQAFGAAGIVGFVLGLLGGNFFPPGSLPSFLVRLSRLTPNGWALQAFGTLSLDRGSLHDVTTAIIVLGAMGFAALLAAWAYVQRTVLA